MKRISVKKIAFVGVLAAMVYVASAFLQIKIPTTIGNTRLHMGNVMCLLSGLLLGPMAGGLAAGIGSMLYDLTDPAFITSAPFTFVFKFSMAWVCAMIAYRKDRLQLGRSIVGAVSGSLCYVVLYLGKSWIRDQFVMGLPVDAVMLTVSEKAAVSLVNAVLAVVIAVPLALSLHPVVKKLGV